MAESSSEEVGTTDRKYVPYNCPLYSQTTTSYWTLGFNLFGVNNPGTPTYGTIDDHLNCPTDYFDRCNIVNVNDLNVGGFSDDPLNINGYPHPLVDGVMSVTEQMTLVAQIKNACRNYLDNNYSTSHIVTNYDVYYMTPMCCNDMSIYVNFTAATHCR